MYEKDILKKLNILYQEDDLAVRESFSATLKLVLNELFESSNGKEGLEILKQEPVDIIITDLNMPDMDGIEFTKKVKKIYPDIPIIFFTAHTQTQYLLDAIDYKVFRYLIKPVTVDTLLQTLTDLIKDQFVSKNQIKLFNNIIVDLDQGIILNENEPFALTANEKLFIQTLHKNNPNLVSEEQLALIIWNEDIYLKKDSLYSLISKLRKKIGKESIVNISKLGYKLNYE